MNPSLHRLCADAAFDADTGRLSDAITWYAFGAQKSGAPYERQKGSKGRQTGILSDPEIDPTPRYHRSVDDGALCANGARQDAGELLIESGIISRDGLEGFDPSPDQDAEWAQERFRLIKDILESGGKHHKTIKEEKVKQEAFGSFYTSCYWCFGWELTSAYSSPQNGRADRSEHGNRQTVLQLDMVLDRLPHAALTLIIPSGCQLAVIGNWITLPYTALISMWAASTILVSPPLEKFLSADPGIQEQS